MKKVNAKQLSLVLAAAVSASALAGCGSGGSSSSSSSSSAAESTTAAQTSAVAGIDGFKAFDKQVEIQIPVYDRNVDGLPPVDDNYWTKWVQSQFGDKYNIKVTYVAIPRTDEVTKMNMLIAAGESPDIVFHYDYPQAVAYADQGALQEIDMEQFKQIAPTYYKNMEDYGILQYCKLNGKDMFVMARRPTAYNWVTLIRQDWIDTVGMKMPKNYSEYTALLDAWIAKGLCKYPLTMSLPTTGYVAGNYPFRPFPPNEEDTALYSDLSIASLTWEPTYKMLKRQNAEYNKGYYSKEYYLDKDGSQAKADFIAGKAGVYANYLTANSDYVSGLLQNNPNAKLAVLSPYAGLEDGQVPAGRAYWPFGMILGFSSQSSADEIKAVEMLLEWMSQKDNLFTLQNGYEGKNYTLDSNGLPVMQDYKGEERMNYNSNKDMFCLVIEGKDYGSDEANLQVQKITYAPKGYEYLIDDSYKFYKETEKYLTTDYLFSKSIASVAEYKETLLSKWQEHSVKLITCKPDEFDALYKQFSKDYLDSGYQVVLDERKAAYEASKK